MWKHWIFSYIQLHTQNIKSSTLKTKGTQNKNSAYLSASIHMPGRITNSNCTHNLPMIESVYLARMSGNSRTYESIRWEWNWLHLTITTDMEWICSATNIRPHCQVVHVVYSKNELYVNKSNGIAVQKCSFSQNEK